MELWIVFAALFLLFILFIGYFLMVQIKEKENARVAQERKRSLTIINSTEELLAQSAYVPFSLNLMYILNTRVIKELENLIQIEPKNKENKSRLALKQDALKNLMSNNYVMLKFNVPESDQKAIAVLKLVKRLKDIIRTEHNKGHIETERYTEELKRLETLQVTINIENAIFRIKTSTVKGEHGTALQLSHKALDMISLNHIDEYLESKKEFLINTINEINRLKEKENNDHLAKISEQPNDLDVIFGDKKKW